MRTLQMALACLAITVAGCRSNNHTVLLERDLRMQEDQIYQLQSCLEDAQMAREATIRENEALKRELDEGGKSDSGPPIGSDRGGGGPPGDIQPPTVELPGGDALPTPQSSPKSNERPDLSPPTIELPEGSGGASTQSPEAVSKPLESPPTQLVINKRLTGGLDRDGHNGDEGILVVVEPRDAAGSLVRWPGKVSVVLMDPSLAGEAARVARWDFAASEVNDHFMNSVFGRGLQFELPWPGNAPSGKDLQLFVRFTTDDGQKLTTDVPISIKPPLDAPPPDRQTRKNRAAAEEESARKPGLRSRLKSRANDSESPRATRAPATTEAARWPAGGRESTGDAGAEEAPLEANRSNRPEWKPFRERCVPD
jgi:hypothetical protein